MAKKRQGRLRSCHRSVRVVQKYEGNNRVDINIKFRPNQNYEVQIECKTELHPDLNSAVRTQLIDKYIKSNSVPNGVYLVFNFGRGKSLDNIIHEVSKNIPESYQALVAVFIVDLGK